MLHSRLALCAAVAAITAAAAAADPAGERILAGWFSVTTADGWTGRRYVDGDSVFAEEFDSNGDGRIDIWRFYRRGILSSEERDLNADGRVDFVTKWDSRLQRLLSASRDTRTRGVNDFEIEALDARRWEIREDRNGDGIADRILVAAGPYDFFAGLGLDLGLRGDVIDKVPPEYWVEYSADDAFTGSISDFRRYRRGRQTHWGEWRERRVVWRRVSPRNPPARQASAPARSADAGIETGTAAYPPPAEYGGPPAGAAPYADPDGQASASGALPGYGEGAGTYPGPGFDPAAGAAPAARDRTRYDGLPPGESAARSLPARMRPPGAGRR